MRIKTLAIHLSTSSEAEKLAVEVFEVLSSDERIVLDFSETQIITPSFVNTFVFTMLAEMPVESLRIRCELRNRNAHVISAFSSAMARFRRGVRLSSQALEPV